MTGQTISKATNRQITGSFCEERPCTWIAWNSVHDGALMTVAQWKTARTSFGCP
jgi:hypothetical protein